MENKTLVLIFIVALVASVLFLGAAITGLVVYKVEYNDLCRTDDNCPDNQCCIIYQEENLGLCMDNCQSFDFLCSSDDQCEEETVCCLPEGRNYGICNYPEKCMDVDVFAEYIGKITFVDMPTIERMMPELEKPAPIYIDSTRVLKAIIIFETIALIVLIIFIIWLFGKIPKRKRS